MIDNNLRRFLIEKLNEMLEVLKTIDGRKERKLRKAVYEMLEVLK